MSFQRHGEIVQARAVAFGAEEVVVGDGRLRDGAQGVHAGIADGRGRQTGVEIGVVGRVELQVEGREGIRPPVPLRSEGVLDGGVAVQFPARTQAVEKDGGDERHLVMDDGFAFDDGGEDDGLMDG